MLLGKRVLIPGLIELDDPLMTNPLRAFAWLRGLTTLDPAVLVPEEKASPRAVALPPSFDEERGRVSSNPPDNDPPGLAGREGSSANGSAKESSGREKVAELSDCERGMLGP
jgi:hypothetical protein